MTIQDRYYRWFLDNFLEYKYVGKKARELKKRIKLFYLENIEDYRELKLLYSNFLSLYKGDIFSVENGGGIYPKTGDFYLLFEVEDLLVPQNFLSYYERLDQSYIEGTIDFMINERMKYYEGLISRKDYLLNKCDIAVRQMGNHDREFIILKDNIITFTILLVIPLICATLLIFEPIYSVLGIDKFQRFILIVLLYALTSLYGFIIIGFVSDNGTMYKGKQINMDLFDTEKSVKQCINELSKIDRDNLVGAIKKGNKIKGKIKDQELDELFSSIDENIDNLEKGKLIKTKAKRSIYEMSNIILDIAIDFTYLSIYFRESVNTFIILAISIVAGILVSLLVRKLFRRISIKVIITNLVLSLIISVLVMLLINLII